MVHVGAVIGYRLLVISYQVGEFVEVSTSVGDGASVPCLCWEADSFPYR